MANVFESGWRITRWGMRSWEGIVCILCVFSPGFQGGVGMEIRTVMRGREVLRNL